MEITTICYNRKGVSTKKWTLFFCTLLLTDKFANALGDGAFFEMGAGGVVAIRFQKPIVFLNSANGAAMIQRTAIAGKELFCFHLLILRDAQAHRGKLQPLGSNGAQILGKYHLAGGDGPGIGGAVDIYPKGFATIASGEA